MSSDQEIRLNAALDWLEKGHITTTQAAARIDPESRRPPFGGTASPRTRGALASG